MLGSGFIGGVLLGASPSIGGQVELPTVFVAGNATVNGVLDVPKLLAASILSGGSATAGLRLQIPMDVLSAGLGYLTGSVSQEHQLDTSVIGTSSLIVAKLDVADLIVASRSEVVGMLTVVGPSAVHIQLYSGMPVKLSIG